MIELLEHRRLFSTGPATTTVVSGDGMPPTLLAVQVLGPPGQATGITLTFSKPMDPAGAASVASYKIQGIWKGLPSSDVERWRLSIRSASYDDTSHTVTLIPARQPFDPGRYLRKLVVYAAAATDTSGQPLDGNGDGVGGDSAVRFFHMVRKRGYIKYSDSTRSRVELRLNGPGELRLFQLVKGRRRPVNLNDSPETYPDRFVVTRRGDGLQLWVEGATSESVLTGTVTAAHGGDATTTLLEIINPDGARLDLLNDPSFQVTGA